ncbi:helix-turn-helix domain-containing protein [Dietzia sp. ANT_WB102]|uniref:helix-turn-helix domain-containing protein n=1 Tax=Dietzia sp. ANT_WB102 TaxID=2597345 RepID=UPI0011EFEFD7|nr:helix-turn-helix domain-containing protein [Dietzia sp. ANT_WB102]KAA0918709.1 transcriptional regulator [Dietzia sp. ANT_WB102]
MSLHAELRFSDPGTFAARSIRAHELALAGGMPTDVDSRVLHAWRRSGDAGICPDQQLPASVLARDEIAEARARTPLRHVADDVVACLADTSAAGRHLVVLSDVRGRVLWRAGSPQALRRADSIAFAEGADWSERGIGANGISLALDVGTLTHATAGEHYVRAHHGWTCTASPIRDAHRRVIGVLDVSHPLRFSCAETVSLVRCGVRLAETLLAARNPDELRTPTPGSDDPAPAETSNPVTSIRLLGWRPAVIRADGTSVSLTPRRAELLALLASREAWSARALSEALYDDGAATTTVRGEVRRLRQLTGLSIGSQPYCLAAHERQCVDYLSVEHPDDLLPDSEIPAIIDLRYGI